jgi:putative ABC transport system permease protein
VLIGQGYADPASWQSARAVMPSAAFSNIWFSLDPAAVSAGNAAVISQQARKFTGVAHQISAAAVDPYDQSVATSLSFTSRLSDFLDLSLTRNAVTLQSFAMLASGPFGALLATLVLASRLFVRRLEPTVTLLGARGATEWQLRGLAASSVVAWTLPAAIVGSVAGTLLASGRFELASIVVPVAVSIGAALIVAIATLPRTGRADGNGRPLGRLVLELVIVALSAASVIVLLQRGSSADQRTAGSGPPPLDPLLAAEPLLLALLGAVIVVRVYPLLLGRIMASARRRPGLTGFLGSAGASRQPPGGPITAVAVLVGVSIAVFSGSLLTTLRTGIEDAAVTTVGADLRVDSPTFSDDEFTAIAGLDGVVDAASVYTATSVIARVGSGRESLSVIVVDTDELRRVQSGQVGAVELPAGLANTGDAAIPVIISDQAAALFGSDDVTIGGNELDVLATVPGEVALSSARTWVLVDSANAPTLMGLYSAPDRLFASLAETADSDAVAAETTELAGDDATVRTPQKLSHVQQASPNIAALDVAVVLAILLSGVCCALVMVMTLALGATARARLFGILSALGLTRRQARVLTAWEIAPVAAVALIAGALVGLALPLLVIAGTDLTPFTGGSSQPVIVIDPLLTASIVGAFVLVAVAAVSTFALAVRSARWKKDDV